MSLQYLSNDSTKRESHCEQNTQLLRDSFSYRQSIHWEGSNSKKQEEYPVCADILNNWQAKKKRTVQTKSQNWCLFRLRKRLSFIASHLGIARQSQCGVTKMPPRASQWVPDLGPHANYWLFPSALRDLTQLSFIQVRIWTSKMIWKVKKFKTDFGQIQKWFWKNSKLIVEKFKIDFWKNSTAYLCFGAIKKIQSNSKKSSDFASSSAWCLWFFFRVDMESALHFFMGTPSKWTRIGNFPFFSETEQRRQLKIISINWARTEKILSAFRASKRKIALFSKNSLTFLRLGVAWSYWKSLHFDRLKDIFHRTTE